MSARTRRTHRLDRDTDRCVCGGMWVYFEPYADLNGVYGCELQGHEDALKHNADRDTNDRITNHD